jgi:hypothetical protein
MSTVQTEREMELQSEVADLVQELQLRVRRVRGETSDPDIQTFREEFRNQTPEELFARLRNSETALYGEGDIHEVSGLPPVAPAQPAPRQPMVEPVLDNETLQRRNAASVVALIPKGEIPQDPASTRFTLTVQSAETFHDLCADEQFAKQLVARCIGSGFLVGLQTVATAFHCVDRNQILMDPADLRFVFGFEQQPGGSAQTGFGPDDVYAFDSIIAHDPGPHADWALVKLDRPVNGRRPLECRATGAISVGTGVYVIGHPLGLAKKLADGANVRQASLPSAFFANLDVYGGNSGSPVFNASDHRVEGILIAGEVSFLPCPSCNPPCNRSLPCPDNGCSGEEVVRILEVLANHPLTGLP